MTADPRLDLLSTHWSLFQLAHHGPADQARSAVERLFERYSPAVARYLRGALRDPDAADELHQEFALKLARGDFRNVHPGGSFRKYLKTVLVRLVTDHHRLRARAATSLIEQPVAPADDVELDAAVVAGCRTVVLDRAWARLKTHQEATGRPVYTVLSAWIESGLTTADLAARLSERLGRERSDGWVRGQMHTARKLLAEFVVAEVERATVRPTAAAVADELMVLGLYELCRGAFNDRWPAE